MPQPLLHYRASTGMNRAPCRRRVWVATALMAAVVIFANAILLAIANADRSWGALGIEFFIGPITNGVIALIALACAPIVKQISGGANVVLYALLSVGLPVVAIAADFAIISSMDLHGC